MLRTLRAHAGLVAFAGAYVVGFAVYGVLAKSPLTVSYVLTMVLAGGFVATVHGRVGFSRAVLWALGVWGLLHMAGGIVQLDDGRVLYNAALVPWPLQYDRLVHAFGFGTATIACWQALREKLAPVVPQTAGLALLVGLMGMGVGAVNEGIEFAATLVLEETNVGGFENTGWDLIFNTLGCTVAAGWVYLRGVRLGIPVRS